MNNINKENALNFEHLCVEKHRDDYNEITYHWSVIPEYVLFDSGFITDFNKLRIQRLLDKKKKKLNTIQEYGLDGISINMDSGDSLYNGLQMKLWDKKLCANHLGTFYQVMFCRMQVKNKLSKGYIYHTCKLEINLSDDIKNTYGMMNSIYIKNPYLVQNNIEKELILRDYQIEAIEALSCEWGGVKLLNCPCGTGKTNICVNYLKSVAHKNIFIFSPLRVHAKQILDRFEEVLVKYEMLLVDSDNDGSRDFSDIVKAIKKKCVISSTYKSAEDIIAQLFEIEKKPKKVNSTDSDNSTEYNKKYNLSDSILIIDEAHNLINKDNLQKLIKCFPKVLLLTATPPCQMEEIIGCETIYKYDFGKAIENKYICNYKIYLPLVEKKIVNIEQPVELSELDDDLCKKGLFVINGMLKTGSRRCIIYLSSIDECNKFGDVLLDVMNKYHGLPCWVNTITSEISANNRKTILDDFQSDSTRPDTFKFLCSVRILDEGVDIVKCDSVFITHIGNKENDIRIVQRICRANRIDKVNPNKVASCFLWCDDINRSLQTLQLLKDNDLNFNSKISIVNSNYDIGHEVKLINKIAKCNTEFNKFINVKCLSADEMWEFKKCLLFEFCDKYSRCIKTNEMYKNLYVGRWFSSQKPTILNSNSKMYKKLSTNQFVKENLDEYIKNRTKVKLSRDEWISLLFTFCDEYCRCPENREQYKNYNIGQWFQDIKKEIVSKNDKLYQELSINEHIKKSLDKCLLFRIANKDKKQFSEEEKKELLFNFADKHQRCPKHNEHYAGLYIGKWYGRKKTELKFIHDDTYISFSENKYVKDNLDLFLQNRDKPKLTFDEWKKLLFDCCNKNEKPVTYGTIYDGHKVGVWLSNQSRNFTSCDDDIYKILAENKYVKENLEGFLKRRNEKIK